MRIKHVDIFPEYKIDFVPATGYCLGEEPSENCPWGMNESGTEIYPPGISRVVLAVYQRYKKPIVISENGTSDSDDSHRPWFIVSHIARLWEIYSQVELIGYFWWTLVDNLEWTLGYKKKFGLFEVDFSSPDRKRIPRKSAEIYGKIAKFNGIPPELLTLIK